MKKIAIDVGYGDVKVKTDTITFKFPSVYSIATVFKDFDGSLKDVGYYKTGNREEQYIIGKNLLDKTGQLYVRDFKTIVTVAPFFIYHAIQKIKEKGQDTNFDVLLVGLTLLEWDRKELFFDAVKEINIDDEFISMSERYAFKQGEGIYYNNVSTDKMSKYIGVVDIGYNTVDVLVFKDQNVIRERSFVLSLGVENVISDLKKYITQNYQLNLSENSVRNILRERAIDVDGESIDLSNMIRVIANKYINGIITDVDKYFRGLEIYQVIVSGGGAYLLEDINLPRNFVLSKKPYEYQNVEGYFNYYDNLR